MNKYTIIYGVALIGKSINKHWDERDRRVFGNWVLGKIFVAKREEVTGDWKWLLNDKLHDLLFLPNLDSVILW